MDDNRGLLSPRDMALLLGVTEREVIQEWQRQRAADPDMTGMTLPKAWLRHGKETVARLGVSSLTEALRLLEAEQTR